MTRAELIEALASRQGHLLPNDVDLAARTILAQISDSLANGQRVEVRGFGAFSLRYRQPGKSHNPKTGEMISLPGRYALRFKVGSDLRKRVLSLPNETHKKARTLAG